MKKISNKKILNIFTLCIVIIVPILKMIAQYLYALNIIRYVDSINPAIVLYVSLPFLLYIYIKDIRNDKRKLDIYDYLFYMLLFTGSISSIFSIDKFISIFGTSIRNEGLLTIITYYLLFINWKANGTSQDIKKYTKLIFFIGVINMLYSYLQIYTKFPFIIGYKFDISMASGLCGNPNFFGSLIVTVISMMTYNYLSNKSSFKNIFFVNLLFVALINSQSTGPFLTYIIVIIFLIIVLYKKNQLIKANSFLLIIFLIFTYSIVYFYNNEIKSLNKCETCLSSIKETIKSGGTGRLEIWRNSLDIVKDNFLVGVGFDNFYLAYPNPKIESGITLSISNNKIEKKENYAPLIYDNAHNVYLHTLVSTGFLGLIPYLLLCLLTFIKGLKSKNRQVLMLLSGFVAYSIQAFANISVIQVAPIYYIIIGLILSIKEEPNETSYIY